MNTKNPARFRKKLIEVALPLDAINTASAREKSIRHGHPSTLHVWWARRPLAACRAVLFASFVDDPEYDPLYAGKPATIAARRDELFQLVEELVKWENSDDARILNRARAEIAASVASWKVEQGDLEKNAVLGDDEGQDRHDPNTSLPTRITVLDVLLKQAMPDAVDAFLQSHAPAVLDPFAGGGSIPLEAQRLGLRVRACDLNPVAVLINKALVELSPACQGLPPINPKAQVDAFKVWDRTRGLAEDIRFYGQIMGELAEGYVEHLYQPITISESMVAARPDLSSYRGQTLKVIAWLWAHTVTCPNPACGCELPLFRSYSVSTRAGSNAWISLASNGKRFDVDICVEGKPPSGGTVQRSGATCPNCSASINLAYIRAEGRDNRIGNKLLCIVAQGNRERLYLPPIDEHERLAGTAEPSWTPTDLMPREALGFRVQLYGITEYAGLFSARQLTFLSALLLAHTRTSKLIDDAVADRAVPHDFARAIKTLLGLAVGKSVVFHNMLARWRPNEGKSAPAFGRQTLSFVWDWTEANPFAGAGGDLGGIVEGTARVVENLPRAAPGVSEQEDATKLQSAPSSAVVCTDPPYYDNIGYADLSDFFYIWLRPALREVFPGLLSTLLSPKSSELIAAAHRFDGDTERSKAFFEDGLREAFTRLQAIQDDSYPLTLFYAFKQAETIDAADGSGTTTASTGWETMLDGLLQSGYAISGTLPIRTEGGTRMRAMGSNALASSVVLVCRARSEHSSQVTRREFLNSLKTELPAALRVLQHTSIAPVDLAQAAIGPGMAVFSRYSKVMESDGSRMTVRTALSLINQVLDEVLEEQEGEFDPDTRWAVTWFAQHGHDSGPFGDAEQLSKSKNVGINGLVESGILAAKGGRVRLLGRGELDPEWNPSADARVPVWEMTQQLIRRLEEQGEERAAELVGMLGEEADVARDLAYRLYIICERNGWAKEALSYNGLVTAWTEMTRLVPEIGTMPEQESLL